ncbi:MAG: hypothetical protein K2Q22_04020 [Cytophagales bacterium]|nr:hypothetical protein [Cytophagales bacterium]
MQEFNLTRFIIRISGVIFFLLAIALLIVEYIFHVEHLPSRVVAFLLILMTLGFSIFIFFAFFAHKLKKNRY